jgi:hypothetical protein
MLMFARVNYPLLRLSIVWLSFCRQKTKQKNKTNPYFLELSIGEIMHPLGFVLITVVSGVPYLADQTAEVSVVKQIEAFKIFCVCP